MKYTKEQEEVAKEYLSVCIEFNEGKKIPTSGLEKLKKTGLLGRMKKHWVRKDLYIYLGFDKKINDGEKLCASCGQIKTLDNFYKDKYNKDGLNYNCKDCCQKKSKSPKTKERMRNYQRRPQVKAKAQKRRDLPENKLKKADYDKVYRSTEKRKIIMSKNRPKHNETRRKKYHDDPIERLKQAARNHIKRGFKNICEKKDVPSSKILGCSWEEFKIYLEDQFYQHPETGQSMTFDNHGSYGWHLDHIKPLVLAKSIDDVKELNHYSNFQPLWAEDNLKKGAKYEN